MKLHFMKDDALVYFKNNISSNLNEYSNPDNSWVVKKYCEYRGADVSPYGEFKFEVPDFKLDMSAETPSEADLNNIRILYSNLKNVSEIQAADERFWVGLAHNEFWDYMQYRCGMTSGSFDKVKVLNNYFFKFGKKRSLIMHPLPRLWWVGHLVYDEKAKDPFECLEAFKNDFSGKMLSIFSNNYMNNPEIARAYFKAIIILERNGEVVTRERFRELSKYVNALGGIIILDYLSEEELRDKILDHYCEIYSVDKNSLVIPESKEYVYVPKEEPDSTDEINYDILTDHNVEIIESKGVPYVVDKYSSDGYMDHKEQTSLENINETERIDPAAFLESKGIKCNDGRNSGGNLWVKYHKDIEDILVECEQCCNIKFNRGKTFWKMT